jgi:regulator of cell morphogenesis and NO signaling
MSPEITFEPSDRPPSPGNRDGREPSAPWPETADWLPSLLAEQAAVIQATHHAFLRRELPRLAALAREAHDRHVADAPALGDLRATFDALHRELVAHLDSEEHDVFPRIRRLEAEGRPAGVAVAVRIAECGHAVIDRALRRLEDLTVGGGPSPACCATCRSLCDGLAELQADLRRTIQLEDGLLFPKAVAAEALVLDRAEA